MASNLSTFATETDQPAKLWLPTPTTAGDEAPCGPVKVSLPAKVLCWKDEDSSQDGLPLSVTLPANSPSTDGSATPSGARSRSGSNMLTPPGLGVPPGIVSLGSLLHGTGNCRPCAWFWKPNGCQNAQECNHCHLCPEGEIKGRKKNKLTMMRLGIETPTATGLATPTASGLDSVSSFSFCLDRASPLVAPLNMRLDSASPLVNPLNLVLDNASPLINPLNLGLDNASPLTFGYPGFGLMGAPELLYPPCPPWFFPDAAMAPLSEHEATTASGSEQGSLISSGLSSGQVTASPSTERDSAANDSRSASEKDEQEATTASLGPPPGLKAPPNTPSHGSVLHTLGNCRPCAWFHKPTGCESGQECKYCHVCSDGELKSRKKNKQAAMRLGLMTPKGDSSSEVDTRYSLSLASCV